MNFSQLQKMPILFLLLILSPFPAETSCQIHFSPCLPLRLSSASTQASLCPKHQHQGISWSFTWFNTGADYPGGRWTGGAARSFCLYTGSALTWHQAMPTKGRTLIHLSQGAQVTTPPLTHPKDPPPLHKYVKY